MNKLVRITTVPLSLEKLLENQLSFMSKHFEVVAVSSEKGRLEQFGHDNNVRTFCVGLTRQITPLKDLKALWAMYRFLKREKPLIVHTHTPKAGIIGMFAAKLAGVPLRLHTVAGLPLLETTGFKRKLLSFVERMTYICATKVFPNSFGLMEIIKDKGFCKDEAKLKVIGNGSSNGIDTSYFAATSVQSDVGSALKTSLRIKADDIVFVFIGRLVSDKGINELVEAFSDLSSFNKPNRAKLILVGPLEMQLDPLNPKTLTTIHTNSNIITLGYQQDVRPYISISNVLVFPSYREGFPNVVMQAGSMGLPAIVSDINGCNELIVENENGFIVPVKNKEALLQGMLKFVKNPSLVKILGSVARQRIVEKYEREIFWEMLLKEYHFLEQDILNS